LTGLSNRRDFSEKANFLLAQSKRNQSPLSVMLIDADHFKNINDTFGHDVGDLTLVAISKTCHHIMRETDIVARFGGEEFTILMPDTSLEIALKVAERLRDALAKTDVQLANGKQINFTVSIGVSAVSIEENDAITAAIKLADQAMYKAKENGRNQVQFIAADPENQTLTNM